ncbi:hypothetical protein [Clostridium sp.]|jgi:hypothetical protein|uniref:hypothetical protein n=1 Tax=Clostridium sp. TaxID=1506 RepID=UPI0025C42C08|nr:hypothetical protein [Clostridium sp.]MCI9070325.1 hypothetical protein [Clostridium sp.]
MDREKIKLDENIKNKKDLIKIIEEKEIEIENQKLKLQLANEEIEKIKLELEQLKREISESIVDTFNIDLKEKRLSNIIEISEKEKSNISIELVEINEEEFIDEHINDIENETDVMGKKDSANEDIRVDNDIIVEELGVNSIEEKEEDELTLIERLKLVFIENKDSDIKQILDEILNSIIDIEDTLRFENKIFLLYISYFYNKLDELLNKSKAINECYNLENDEVNLLKMIIKEKEYSLYNEEKEIVSNIVKDNKNLFINLDAIVRGRIIDKIKNTSYKAFEGVYSVKDLMYGEKNITLKAWVKEKENDTYRLVEGLYSNNTDKLYMLEVSIGILGLNIKKLTDDELKDLNSQNYKVEDKMYKEEKSNSTNDLEKTCKIEKIKEEQYIIKKDKDKNVWKKLKGALGLKPKK